MIKSTNLVVSAKQVCKSFEIDKNHNLNVLEDINLEIYENEMVAFLGKSGTGKSTLLRIIAGLLEPTSGKVWCNGEEVSGPSHNMSMVFQNFALMPWLSVFENVAFGLEALGRPKAEIKKIAQQMIDLIGLSGYENSYPKELSGGMKQRVGFARALAVEPDLLLLDEPFSALDIYTANKIKTDLIGLWEKQQIKTRAMILVTHNVEEAVLLSDRILVWDSNPGRIAKEFKISMPRHERTKRNMLDLIEDIANQHHMQIAHAEEQRLRQNN